WNPADGSPPPSGWVAGEPVSTNLPHYLQTVQVGDMLYLNGEFMRVRAKHSSTSWDVERAVLASQGGGQHAGAHHAGENLVMWCEAAISINTYSGGYVFWDFVNSPTGVEHPEDYKLNTGSHPVTRGTHRAEYGFNPTAPPTDKSQWGRPYPNLITMHPSFAGVG